MGLPHLLSSVAEPNERKRDDPATPGRLDIHAIWTDEVEHSPVLPKSGGGIDGPRGSAEVPAGPHATYECADGGNDVRGHAKDSTPSFGLPSIGTPGVPRVPTALQTLTSFLFGSAAFAPSRGIEAPRSLAPQRGGGYAAKAEGRATHAPA